MIDIPEALHELSVIRPIFHSEADFQHALAWQIQKHYEDAKIRLEYRFESPHGQSPAYIDIWIENQGVIIAIELKYLTKAATVTISSEKFALNNHGGHNQRSYHIASDIERLERVVKYSSRKASGFCCVLTNDATYWNPPRSTKSYQRDAFRTHEGNTLAGTLAWPDGNKAAERQRRIDLRGAYSLSWQPYSQVADNTSGLFKYLLLKVDLDRGNLFAQ